MIPDPQGPNKCNGAVCKPVCTVLIWLLRSRLARPSAAPSRLGPQTALALFEAEAPADGRPRDAIARARAFARGELSAAEEIRRRFVAGRAAREVNSPAAVAAARSAAQAAAVAHMGARALGAAAYAAKAAGLAASDQTQAVDDEIRWQLVHMSAEARLVLRRLPPLGSNSAGPLGPGLLASGILASVIRTIQADLNGPAQPVSSS
ncbi:putative immunity protein [uncultured Arthrobacter sp.]|uniref:putative immunity protein n=1 Tax=uncultured Arthrobacter sp. TaxID=114050 RepID=UPI0037DCFF92